MIHALLSAWDWLLSLTGANFEGGRVYGFWSGFAGSNIAMLGGIWLYLRHSNCIKQRCWRVGRHKTAAGHPVCKHHNPELRGRSGLSGDEIDAAHEAAKARK